jgi:hypothetical protein
MRTILAIIVSVLIASILVLFSLSNPKLVFVYEKTRLPGVEGIMNGKIYYVLFDNRNIKCFNIYGVKEVNDLNYDWDKVKKYSFIKLKHELYYYQ